MNRIILPLAVLAFGAAAFWVLARPSSGVSTPADGSLAAALARIEDKQDALAERVARMEALQPHDPGERFAYRPAAGANVPGSSASIEDNGRRAPSPGALPPGEQRKQLEARLVGEPLSPAWASTHERAIASLMSPANLAKQQLPAPHGLATRCQSKTCRISMHFADEQQASQTQVLLLMEIAGDLPNARSFLEPAADGSVELVVFAGDVLPAR
jgi:hypothetical protein